MFTDWLQRREGESRSVIGLLPSATNGIWLAAGHGQEQRKLTFLRKLSNRLVQNVSLLSRANKDAVYNCVLNTKVNSWHFVNSYSSTTKFFIVNLWNFRIFALFSLNWSLYWTYKKPKGSCRNVEHLFIWIGALLFFQGYEMNFEVLGEFVWKDPAAFCQWSTPTKSFGQTSNFLNSKCSKHLTAAFKKSPQIIDQLKLLVFLVFHLCCSSFYKPSLKEIKVVIFPDSY